MKTVAQNDMKRNQWKKRTTSGIVGTNLGLIPFDTPYKNVVWKIVPIRSWISIFQHSQILEENKGKYNIWEIAFVYPRRFVEILPWWGDNQDTMCCNYQWHIGWNLCRIYQNWKYLLLGQDFKTDLDESLKTACWNTCICKMLELVFAENVDLFNHCWSTTPCKKGFFKLQTAGIAALFSRCSCWIFYSTFSG